jgi:tryptophan synthase beta chain
LRYHGKTPVLSALVKNKLVETRTVGQSSIFDAGRILLKTEGILPAPESSHALRAAIEIARHSSDQDVIVICLSGHGYLDLKGYAVELSLE